MRRAGVGRETLRYYEREGLLPRPPRTSSGYRVYPSETLDRIRFIRRAKELGFPLRDIRELLDKPNRSKAARTEVRRKVRAKIAELRKKAEEIRRAQSVLERLLRRCLPAGSAGA